MATPSSAVQGSPSESVVDRDSHFDGLYKTQQNLKVEGQAEGEIQCQGTLTVEQGARVKAKVTARNVTVAGELEGEVICQDVFKITPSGQVEATVTASRLIVQEGGFYNGEFKMTKADSSPIPSLSTNSGRKSRSTATTDADDWRSYLTTTEREADLQSSVESTGEDGSTEKPA
jgi:cytoskeletal protein CcmA (bactofilin family)